MTNSSTTTKKKTSNDDNTIKTQPHEFRASSRFLLTCLVMTFVIPFLVGLGTTRLFHVMSPSVAKVVERLHPSAVSLIREQQEAKMVEDEDEEDDDDEDEEDDEDEDEDETVDAEDDDDDDDDDDETPKTRQVPPGSGLQLSVDIFSVDPSILSSQDYLLSALDKIISSARLTLQSLHYNKHLSSDGKLKGWNGVGLLSEGSHVSLNTWIGDDEQDGGSVFFSLLSSSNDQLKLQWEVLPIVEKELGVGVKEGDEPLVEWSLVQRQFRIVKGYPRNVYWEDLCGEYTVLSKIMKMEIASAQSPFQRIDVYDIVDPKETSIANYQASLLPPSTNTYQSLHPELFLPTRIVFLDGVMQSTSRGNEAYHEALVQPALFAHDEPKRVAIIGGGEGATLREVLKHESLEKCVMIEIDEIMVKESATHLYPRWNGCGDFVGSEDSCFDDSRADIRYEDALAWFINRFYEEPKTTEETEDDDDDDSEDKDDEEDEEDEVTYDETEKFDVIIMDALDPQDTVEFADVLYQNDVFLTSLYNALNDDGILVAQLGESPVLVDPPEEESNDANRLNVIKTMERLGFKSMHMYDEHNCGFEGPWTYLVACKDTKCRKNWYKNPAQIDEAIHRRIKRTHSGKPLLEYFDGTTMASYQMPRRAVETVYCRQSQYPAECQFGSGWNHHSMDDDSSDDDDDDDRMEPTIVKSSDVFQINVSDEDGSVTSVTAARDIPSMSYIETEGVLRIPASVVDVIEKAREAEEDEDEDEDDDEGRLDPLIDFIEQSGIDMDNLKAKGDLYLGIGLPSIIKNANQDQEPNVGHLTSWMKQQDVTNNVVTPEGYDPVIIPPASAVMARHLPHFEGGHLFTLKSIKKGEEILKNPSTVMV